jgi:hypothetical protein
MMIDETSSTQTSILEKNLKKCGYCGKIFQIFGRIPGHCRKFSK